MGWKLQQVSTVDGPFTLLVVASGVKAVFPERHFVYLCAAPTWEAVVYNVKSKTIINFKTDYWRGFHVGDDKVTGSGKSVTTNTRWHGRPALLVNRSVVKADPLREQVEMLYRDGAGRARKEKSEELTVANWDSLAAQTLLILRCFHRMMNLDNMLLRRVHCYESGKNDVVLDTFACAQVRVLPADLRYPVGYKTAERLAAVTEEDKRRKDAMGVFQDLFEDSRTGRKGKNSDLDRE